MIRYPLNYCVFDFETTGLSPEKDHIIEIGALKKVEGRPDEIKSWLVKWPGVQVTQTTIDITGITQEMVDTGGWDPDRAFMDFFEFAGNLPLVGHNIVRFDLPFLFSTMDRLLFAKFDRHEAAENCVDTAALYKAKKLGAERMWNETFHQFAVRVLEIRAFGVKYNVGICCDELGIDKNLGQAHRAGGDVILTNEIYRKICLSL